MEKIKLFYEFGGIRIEDDIIITEQGNEIISKLPKTIKELEDYINA